MQRHHELLYLSQSIELGNLAMQLGEWQAKAREENKDALTQALITVLNADRTIKQLREELSVIQQRSDNDRARLQNCQITSIELRNEIAHLRGSIEEVF